MLITAEDLELEPIAYRKEIDGAVYLLTQVDGEYWDLKRYTSSSIVCVVAIDEEGEPVSWNSLDEAKQALAVHANCVRSGMQADLAVLEVHRKLCRQPARMAS
jgi:hypothetical protein